MDLWFLQDVHRFTLEREAIVHLMRSVDWLQEIEWGIGKQVYVDARLQVAGHIYPIRLTYPSLFPSVPPTIRPQNTDERWSAHQYSDGTLCLEWGPDNWQPNVTGAQMLASAYTLLEIEQPHDHSIQDVAPSRHYQTLGQELRGSVERFFVTDALATFLMSLAHRASGVIRLSIYWDSKSLLTLVTSVIPTGSPVWKDTSIPNGLHKKTSQQGFFVKTEISPTDIVPMERWQDLRMLLEKEGYQIPPYSEKTEQAVDQIPDAALIIDGADTPHLFLTIDKAPGTLLPFTAVKSNGQPALARLPKALSNIAKKSVAVVGLGSVGSKIAVSLARTGVNRFYLVDADVFLPENISRHSLDWRYVGEHKVDAVAAVLNTIVPELDIRISRLHLTGQEATSSLSETLEKLADYDLIIDATADAGVFNLLTAVTITYEKSMLWMEVYAGGIGGFIARSRTGIDPHPQIMRAAYNAFTRDHPAPELVSTGAYAAQDATGQPLVASDADVSVIAGWATRLALDTLVGDDSTSFPYSMYLIGLANTWVFKAPFDTIPIATDNLSEIAPVSQADADLSELAEFLVEILEKRKDAATSTEDS